MHYVSSVAFSPDGSTLASGSSDYTVRLWDAVTGQEKAVLTGHSGVVNSVAFSPDGSTLASGSSDVRLWDAVTGQEKAVLRHRNVVNYITFSPDGSTLASATYRGVRVWDAVTGQEKSDLTGYTDWVWTIPFSPDGSTYASASTDGTVRLWDVVTGQEKAVLTGHRGGINSITFSPDGSTLASGSYGEVRLWDAVTGQEKAVLTGHRGGVNSIAFSPDGSTLASGSDDGTILLWGLTPAVTPKLTGDVSGDGVVNILDLVRVASSFGQAGENDADVNGDGVVNILDLVFVAGEFGNTAAAPSRQPQALVLLTPADVEGWLTQAQGLDLTDVRSQRGILFLEQLLAALTPQETVLLPNYPNPFNPETWIPYHLAHDAEVTLTIYDTKGATLRQLDLGHQPAGYYTARTRAAYWDGRNEHGESVSSGIYFYQLRVGSYTALRRMVIVK